MEFEIRKVSAQAPVLQKMADKDKWAYKEKWTCHVRTKRDGTLKVTIDPGYWTDLASVPKALRGAFDNGSGEYGVLIASQVHDMFYSTHYMSKDFADSLFYALLRHYGMSWAKAKAYYLVVAWFGDKAWEAISDDQLVEDRKLCTFKWLDR